MYITLIVPTVGLFPVLSLKQPWVRGNSEELFLYWTTVCLLIKLCILRRINVWWGQQTLRRGMMLLPREQNNCYRLWLRSMGFVHPRGRNLASLGAISPLGCTKRHGPCHSVQQFCFSDLTCVIGVERHELTACFDVIPTWWRWANRNIIDPLLES